MALDEITEESFEERVLRAETPVLVDFTTPWCGPCRALRPVLEKLSARVRVFVLDADQSPALTARLGIRGFPTVVAFANGVEIARHLGVANEKRLLALLG